MKEYPHDCVRCGMCCISTPCPIALATYEAAKENKTCPCLYFNENDEAICDTMTPENMELFGVGKGCCIKARLIRMNTEIDFASLCKEDKIRLVRRIRGLR